MRALLRFLAVCIPCGLIYYAGEVLWRGYSYPAMIGVGGVAVYLCGRVNERWRKRGRRLPVAVQMPVCGGIITAVELLSGLFLNCLCRLSMWDYSGLPYNFMGQVCPYATLAWTLLSPIAVTVDDVIGWLLFGEPAPGKGE